jgi:hypothetical protein
MPLMSRAWMLDAEAFHREFDELFDERDTPEGVAEIRARAAHVWRSHDPIVAGYLSLLRVGSPDDWEAGYETTHLIDWYRVIMAGFLIPTRAFHSPDLLKRRLPDLGWSPSESRRLAHGRELQLLADAFAAPDVAADLAQHFTLGNKGWLSQDDISGTIDRFRAIGRAAFRGRPELVPLIENAYEVLEAAATKPDHVLLLLAD